MNFRNFKAAYLAYKLTSNDRSMEHDLILELVFLKVVSGDE